MPSGLRKTTGNHFEIYYEQPWGGVASDKDSADIDYSQFVTADGVSIRNGLLCYYNIANQNSKFALTLITPTTIAPGTGGGTPGTGAYVSIPVEQIRGIWLQPDNSFAGKEYLGVDTFNLNIGTDFVITSPYNSVWNTAETVGNIISAFSFTTVSFGGFKNDAPSGPCTLTYFDPNAGGTPAPAQDWPQAYICLVFNANNYLCAVDQLGFAYVATLQTDGTVKFQLDQTAVGAPSTNFGIPTAVKVINGVAYISVYSKHTLYKYTPGVSYIVASTYTAGQFIDIFDEYLIQLNTNSETDGIQPTRINWSAPDEFSIWDAAVNRTAGFQSLTSVEDYISGFIAVDNVGYIFKREGVTQITATGIAIEPFNYTTYWNSEAGQGLIFPGTLRQFGRYIFLTTDSGSYLFYGGQFTLISEIAGAAIYSSFNQNPPLNAVSNALVTAGFGIYPFNDKIPLAEYIFAAVSNVSGGAIVFWVFHPNLKTWTSLSLNALALLNYYVPGATSAVINSIKADTVFLNYNSNGSLASQSNLPTNIFYINFTFILAEISYTQTFIYYNLVNTPTADISSITLPPGKLVLTFKREEFKLGYSRKATIRRVVVKAYGIGTLVLSIQAQDGTFTSLGAIVLDGTRILKTYYSPQGIATVEGPQLWITSFNFNGVIQKVMLAGTFADGEID